MASTGRALYLVAFLVWSPRLAQAQGAPAPVVTPPEAAPAPPSTPPEAAPAPSTPPEATLAPPPPEAAPAPGTEAPPADATTGPSAPSAPPAASAAAAPGQPFGEEIVVTGSRFPRKELSTPAPVTVISREQLQQSGKVSLGEALQRLLPEQGAAINTAVNNGGDGSTRLSLRNLGVQRTLVLLNGRRVMPGGLGADGSVDLGSIPLAAVERVEVLKDGASALYGSDAIAGVVNIITRKRFDGVEVSGYGGTSTGGGGTTYDVSGTAGVVGERGSILFSAGFYKQEAIFAGQRGFASPQRFFDATGKNLGKKGEVTTGSATVPAGTVSVPKGKEGVPVANPNGDPRIDLYNQVVSQYPTTANFIRDPAAPLGWRPFVGTSLPRDGGDLYDFTPPNYLLTPQQRVSLFSSGELALGGGASGYFEASYVNRQSAQQLAPGTLTIAAPLVVSKDSLYNPFGVDIVSARRRLLEFGNRLFAEDVDSFRIVTGFKGSLPTAAGPFAGWLWDVSLNYGRTQGTLTSTGVLKRTPLQNAIGPSMLVNGVPTCVRTAGDPSTAIAGCVPLNLFGGPGSITSAQVNSGLTFTGVQRGMNQLTAVQVNTSGDLFRLWADRPVSLALGYEYRNVQGDLLPDPITAAGDTTGNAILPTAGGYHVNEGYAELSVPILSRLPFAESLEADAAARVFKYSTFGTDWTYKVGGRWSVVRDVTFRGTHSTAFRAPSVGDLFLGQQDAFPRITDPCASAATAPASCGAAAGNSDTALNIRSRLGGSPALRPETARTFTVGVVLEPRWVDNLSVTVDYYDIHIDDAITTVGEATILNGCYPTSGATPNPELCRLITRDPVTHRIVTISNLNANVGKEAVSGVDIGLRYVLPTRALGRFGFRFDGTWLRNHDLTLPDGRVIRGRGTFDLAGQNGNFAGVGGVNPAWRFNTGVTWARGPLGAGVATRFVGSFRECATAAGLFNGTGQCYVDHTYQRKVSAYAAWDTFVSYTLTSVAGATSLAVGVNNLFNATPPAIYNSSQANSDPTAYDFVGRFVYGRITHRL